MIHEILHCCDGCMNHGNTWQALAQKVNKEYTDLNIQRTAARQEVKKVQPAREQYYKYHYKCNGCGQEIKRMKKSKFTKYYDLYTCGICGGKFEQV